MVRVLMVTALLVGFAASSFADPPVYVGPAAKIRPATRPTTKATTKPATRPSAELQKQIDELIQKLGDPQYSVREGASDELRKIGTPALAQLQAARKHTDPEVAARAGYVAQEIEEKNKPAVAERPIEEHGILVPGGQARIILRGGGIILGGQAKAPRQASAEEDGRKIQIREDENGIAVTITQTKDGKETTEEYKAKTAEELKKNHPEAHKLYEKHLGGQAQPKRAVQMRIQTQGQ